MNQNGIFVNEATMPYLHCTWFWVSCLIVVRVRNWFWKKIDAGQTPQLTAAALVENARSAIAMAERKFIVKIGWCVL
jgi:hypothetical protein